MADIAPDATPWLAVIGKALAYLCLSKAVEDNPDGYGDLLAKVDFLRGLGLSEKDAAEAAGSTLNSIQVMRSRLKKAKNGKAKKKTVVAAESDGATLKRRKCRLQSSVTEERFRRSCRDIDGARNRVAPCGSNKWLTIGHASPPRHQTHAMKMLWQITSDR